MAGKGAGSLPSWPPPPPPSSSPSVCCMCGDCGLPQELFRCKVCHFRSQHKYCSDLYPKAEAYRACNWCLRQEGGKTFSRESNTDNNNNNCNGISSSELSSSNGCTGVKLHRGLFSSHLNKPIKKPKAPQRLLSDVNEQMIRSVATELSPGLGRSRQAVRGKVRRYKLLDEVSS